MAKLHVLIAALGLLAVSHARQHAQHIISDPDAESADFIRDKYPFP